MLDLWLVNDGELIYSASQAWGFVVINYPYGAASAVFKLCLYSLPFFAFLFLKEKNDELADENRLLIEEKKLLLRINTPKSTTPEFKLKPYR